jgi:hypothetical protein
LPSSNTLSQRNVSEFTSESILLLMNIQFDDRLSFNYFGTMYLAAVTTLRERKNHYTKLLVI